MGGLVVTRAHDLPPLWDGEPVEWREWRDEPVMFICTRGRRKQPDPPKRCARAAGTARETTQGLIGGLVRLHVVRCCHDCCQDTVLDLETNEVWDLDDTDYGDAGSVDPNQIQGALF